MATQQNSSILETRRDQLFPILEMHEIDRVRRFGTLRTFAAGEALARTGEIGPGLCLILKGKVEVTQLDLASGNIPIVTHGPGGFFGELAQLAGRPTLVDADAAEPVEALVIPP